MKKQERSQIYNLTLHLKELEKVQAETRTRRRKETIKIRADINKIVNRKTIGKINQTKIWFLGKINKIDKLS